MRHKKVSRVACKGEACRPAHLPETVTEDAALMGCDEEEASIGT